MHEVSAAEDGGLGYFHKFTFKKLWECPHPHRDRTEDRSHGYASGRVVDEDRDGTNDDPKPTRAGGLYSQNIDEVRVSSTKGTIPLPNGKHRDQESPVVPGWITSKRLSSSSSWTFSGSDCASATMQIPPQRRRGARTVGGVVVSLWTRHIMIERQS